MPTYKVLLVVSYKASARDPEGETIAHELRSLGYEDIVKVRAGKAFFFNINADNQDDALNKVKKIALETKLYNPSVHEITVINLA